MCSATHFYPRISLFSLAVFLGVWVADFSSADEAKPDRSLRYQYHFEDIAIEVPDAKEPKLETISVDRAVDYIEKGALVWSRQRGCVTCHTNGQYLQFRPELTSVLGAPSKEIRDLFVNELEKALEGDREKLREGLRPAQIATITAGLASWDRHVSGKLSADTGSALKLLLEVQSEDGSWGNTECWPPFESSEYQATTVAAMAMAAAPAWLDGLDDRDQKLRVKKTKKYLRETPPPHDYASLLLLWTSMRMPDLIDRARKKTLIDMALGHQNDDGGWSLRDFASPKTWGDGSRAEKLESEDEFKNPPSDGHQTGLVVLVLTEAGLPSTDPRIQRGVKWLLENQRGSGRWWTRSLNTDKFHYITYSGTLYPLLALYRTGELERRLKTAPSSREF